MAVWRKSRSPRGWIMFWEKGGFLLSPLHPQRQESSAHMSEADGRQWWACAPAGVLQPGVVQASGAAMVAERVRDPEAEAGETRRVQRWGRTGWDGVQ